jgi:hypothetical protein
VEVTEEKALPLQDPQPLTHIVTDGKQSLREKRDKQRREK